MAWPHAESATGVSTVISPVTQTALTAVKNASSPASGTEPLAAMGSESNIPPTKESAAKVPTKRRSG